jgi:hypothetical protein
VTRDRAQGRKRGGITDAAGFDLLLDHGASLRGEIRGGCRGFGVGAGREEKKAEE